MSKFIKLTLKFVSFLCITIFLVFLIFTFNYRSYNDYHYNSPEEFFNSESFSWYVNIFPKSANNIFLRAFIETNEMIVDFDVNKTDEIPISQFYKVASIDRGMAFLKDVNIPGSKKQYFLEGGNLNLYCYIYQNQFPYLVSRSDSENNDIAHYIFISLRTDEVPELCQ